MMNQTKNGSICGNEMCDTAMKAIAIAGGLGLVYEIIRHRKLLLTAAAAAGGAMWVHHLLQSSSKLASHHNLAATPTGAPSFPGENVHPSDQEPLDAVDEAMMESFPASDPPASYHR